MRDRLSKSSISLFIRAACSAMIPRKRCWAGGSSAAGPCNVSTKPISQASGVPYILLDNSFDRTPTMLRTIGRLLGVADRADDLAGSAEHAINALRGRLLSSSYAPAAGHPKHEPMLAELRRIFDRHAENGRVRFEYDTHVYYGQLK